MPEGPTKESASKASNHEVIIAGGMAGLVSRFCIAPLDVIKIRLQLQPHSYRDVIRLGSAGKTVVVEGPIYRGFFPTLRTIIVQEGVTALWKGNIPAEFLYVTYSGTQFFAYRQCHLLLAHTVATLDHPTLHLPDAVSSSVSGAVAGGIATTITYPFDLLRTRFAAAGPSQKVYSSLLQSVKEIYVSEGPTGYFRGLTAGVAQIIPYMGLFFGCYETIRTSFRRMALSSSSTSSKSSDSSIPTPIHRFSNIAGWEDATAGVMAGVLAKTGVFPLDTVRKRLQVQGPTRGRYVHKNIPVYTGGVMRSMRDIFRVEGLRGLYKGLTVGLIKAAPASAVTMWTYERTMVVLRWWEEREDD